MWTRFMDMHSGGGLKEPWSHIYIEAPQAEAESVFYARFDHSPYRVTCTCCGADYAVSEEESLAHATGYDRNCRSAYFRPDGSECERGEAWASGQGMQDGYRWGYAEEAGSNWRPHQTLEEYVTSGAAHFIYAGDILPEERNVTIPDQGYVWVD